MATQDELHTILAKAAASQSFRNRLAANPGTAASAIGITLDPKQLTAFKGSARRLQDSSLDLRITDKVAKIIAVWL
jgi:hypothetical protein